MGLEPRDILVNRISIWIDSADAPYPYADRLIKDLYDQGYEITEIRDAEGD